METKNNLKTLKIFKIQGSVALEAKLNNDTPRVFDTAQMPYSKLLEKYIELKKGKISDKQVNKDFISLDFDWSIDKEKAIELGLEQYLNEEGTRIDKETIREILYKDGFTLRFLKNRKVDKKAGEVIKEEYTRPIKYRFFFRSSSQSRVGRAIFLNEKLYKEMKSFITMGLIDNIKEGDQVKLVELEAYSSLIASSSEGTIKLKPSEILVLEDIESKVTKKVLDVNTDKNGQAIITEVTKEISNILFDGQSVGDKSLFNDNGYGDKSFILTRNHMWKSAIFNVNLQDYFKDYCKEHNLDYNTLEVVDMFENKIKLKDIKVVTTDNSTKYLKFFDNKAEGHKHWSNIVESEGNKFFVVKCDHDSKYGNVQRMSYQQINSLLLTKEETRLLYEDSKAYIERLKNDEEFYLNYLKDTANEVNSNEAIVELAITNSKFIETGVYRNYKKNKIKALKRDMKQGKLFVEANNTTIVSNPLLLMELVFNRTLYTQDKLIDKSFGENTTEYYSCYAPRFKNNEELGAFRNPHNSSNGVLYLKNNYNEDICKRYFNFNENIICVNSIENDIQARANSMDMDSDFVLLTNNSLIISKAKQFYSTMPTVENSIAKSEKKYTYSMLNMATIDNGLAKAKSTIGLTSNYSQRFLSLYAHTGNIEYLNNANILAVLAQVSIDNAKRSFEIDLVSECNRFKKLLSSLESPNFLKIVKENKAKDDKKSKKEIEPLTAQEIAKAKKEIKAKYKDYDYIEVLKEELSKATCKDFKQFLAKRIKEMETFKQRRDEENKKKNLRYRKANQEKIAYKGEALFIDKLEALEFKYAKRRINFMNTSMDFLYQIIEEESIKEIYDSEDLDLTSLINKNVKGRSKANRIESVLDIVETYGNESIKAQVKKYSDDKESDEKDRFNALKEINTNMLEDLKGLSLKSFEMKKLIKDSEQRIKSSNGNGVNESNLFITNLINILYKSFGQEFLEIFRVE